MIYFRQDSSENTGSMRGDVSYEEFSWHLDVRSFIFEHFRIASFIFYSPLISVSLKSPLCFIPSLCNYNTYCETAAVFLPKANTACRLTPRILLTVPLSSPLLPPLFLYVLMLHFLIEISGALSGEDVEVAKVCSLIGVSHKNTHTHTDGWIWVSLRG